MMPPDQSPDCPEPADSTPLSFHAEFDPFEPGLLKKLPEPPRKVVVLRASRIGDFINATPAFRALREALPGARIDIITLPMLKGVAERCTAFDRYLPFPGYPWIAEQLYEPARTLEFIARAQAEQYDLAIQMQGSGVYSNPFMLLLGARYTAGFIRPGDPPGRLSAAVPWPSSGHEAEYCLRLTEHLGAPTPPGALPEFRLLPADQAEAEGWLAKFPRPWIGIHTSARDATRRWPLERFIQAVVELQKRHGGTVIHIGESRDRAEASQALAVAGARFLNLAGCTALPVTGAVLRRLAVFLTNDTGPAHIAYAVGAPTVTIFGGGDPSRNGPLTPGPHRVLAHPVPCRPCDMGECPYELKCLVHVTVEQVIGAAEEIARF